MGVDAYFAPKFNYSEYQQLNTDLSSFQFHGSTDGLVLIPEYQYDDSLEYSKCVRLLSDKYSYYFSEKDIQNIDLRRESEAPDYGRGLYLGDNYNAALNWACRKEYSIPATINIYDVDVRILEMLNGIILDFNICCGKSPASTMLHI